MFTNRFFLWKLGTAAGLFLVLCAYAKRQGEEINPPYWRCITPPEKHPEKYIGARLWIHNAEVASLQPDGFTFYEGAIAVRVIGAVPEGTRVGDRVGLVAHYQKDGTLRAVRMEKRAFQSDIRWAYEAISLAALLWLFFYVRRVYSLRWDRLALRIGDRTHG